MGYKMTKVVRGKQRIMPITAHRLVADIFQQNLWTDLRRNQKQAHHLDGSKANNVLPNIMLLPVHFHNIMNKTRKTCMLKGRKFVIMPLNQILAETGLKIDEIVSEIDKKTFRQDGRWSVFEIKGHFIGFLLRNKKQK